MDLYINSMLNGVLTFEDFLSTNVSNISNALKIKDLDILNKWTPILKSIIGDLHLDDDFLYKFCVYTEVCSIYYNKVQFKSFSNPTIGDLLKKVRNNILESRPDRSGVVRKVYNYRTSSMEYELEDGNFIKINEDITPISIKNISSNVFPPEFVKSFDINEYRDMKINEIL